MPRLQEIQLPPHDGLANLENRLLALLDVLHQLNRGSIAFLHVIADFFARLLIAIEHALVLRVQAQLRDIVVVQLDQVLVAVFEDVNVRLNLARARVRSNADPGADPGA